MQHLFRIWFAEIWIQAKRQSYEKNSVLGAFFSLIFFSFTFFIMLMRMILDFSGIKNANWNYSFILYWIEIMWIMGDSRSAKMGLIRKLQWKQIAQTLMCDPNWNILPASNVNSSFSWSFSLVVAVARCDGEIGSTHLPKRKGQTLECHRL